MDTSKYAGVGGDELLLRTILDNLESRVHVRDIDTDVLLYINGKARQVYPEAKVGERSPSLLCTGSKKHGALCSKDNFLDRKGSIARHTHTVEYYNKEQKKWYRRNATVFPWADGALACLESDTDITEQKETSSRLEHLARYDELLGMPNREKFMEDLASILKDKSASGAILLADLDDFKNINEAFGHNYGDQLLKAMASCICGSLDLASSSYRIGGDEAAFLLNGFGEDQIVEVVDRLLSRFRKPWLVRSREEFCTLSIGVVRYPEHGMTVAELISKADIAMYKAKKAGKNKASWYAEDSETCGLANRVETERRMRCAVQKGCAEFQAFFQPIVDLRTKRWVGAEALARWQSERMGLVDPGLFIPLAEHNGLIVPIGEHLLRRSCAQCREWQRMGARDFYVSVNVSVRQLQVSNLFETVVKVLAETGLAPEHLMLEVTESIAIKEMQRGVEQLCKLRALGVRVALDDFGTGYSSLNNLRKLPLDIVKIDRSFVTDILTDDYHRSFIGFVHELATGAKLRVCTEGIESLMQLKTIETLGGGLGQGYLFGRPLPAGDFSGILMEQIVR